MWYFCLNTSSERDCLSGPRTCFGGSGLGIYQLLTKNWSVSIGHAKTLGVVKALGLVILNPLGETWTPKLARTDPQTKVNCLIHNQAVCFDPTRVEMDYEICESWMVVLENPQCALTVD